MTEFYLNRKNKTNLEILMNYKIMKFIRIILEIPYMNYTLKSYEEENKNINLYLHIPNLTEEKIRKIRDYIASIDRDPIYLTSVH